MIIIFHRELLGLLLDRWKTKWIWKIKYKNMKIPSVYKKGDFFFEIINAWNNLPEKIKAIYIKKRIKEFLKND